MTGALPAISGANLTGIAATDNVRTGILDVAGIATFRSDVNIPNINGGQIGGRRNLIINGAMNVAQRGTSHAAIAHNAYGIDRFKFTNNTSAAYTLSQSSTSPDGFANSLKLDCTTADTSITPVRIDMSPDNTKTQRLPERAHRKNPSTPLGGGPFAGAL